MRKTLITTVAAGIVGFGVLAAPLAAYAATSADTPASFGVSAGFLTISTPPATTLAPINLGSVAIGTATVAAPLGTVSVDDQRGALTGVWNTQVTSSAFVTSGATGPETIGAAAIGYASGSSTILHSGDPATYTGYSATGNLSGSGLSAMSASGEVGLGGVSWDPTITVHLPAQVVAGTYTGTITHSVA